MSEETRNETSTGVFGELPPGPWRWSRTYQVGGGETCWCLKNEEHAARGETIDPSTILRLNRDTWLGEPFLNNPVARLLAMSRELLDVLIELDRHLDFRASIHASDEIAQGFSDLDGINAAMKTASNLIAEALNAKKVQPIEQEASA